MICKAHIVSPGLQYQLDRNQPLSDPLFRHGTRMWGVVLREARALYQQGLIDDLDEDDFYLLESDAGELAWVGSKEVMLDTPEINWDRPGWLYVYSRDTDGVVVRVDLEHQS